MLLRRVQLIEYLYSEKAGAPPSAKGGGKGANSSFGSVAAMESAVFVGTHRDYGAEMVAPSLLTYVASEVEKDASVLKQVRKAREERASAAAAAATQANAHGGGAKT